VGLLWMLLDLLWLLFVSSLFPLSVPIDHGE
jgi:hypothetical protein